LTVGKRSLVDGIAAAYTRGAFAVLGLHEPFP
jgi:hypothetical protein